MSARMLTVLLATLAFTFTAQVCSAQDVFGTINGTVTDSTGAAVAGANVKITNEQTGVSRPVIANEDGYYVASQLPVGSYAVAATIKGFKVTTKSGNDLAAGAHLTVDLTLQVGQATETVQVTATGQSVNQTSAEIAPTVTARILGNMSLNERNYVQLSTLIPGAPISQGNFDQTAFTTGQGLNPSVINGQRGDGNLWTVDGGYNMDSGSNASQVNNVGIDFVQEVNIQTSNYDAEYGRSNGASINVVTKSGGDAWHGTLFEYVRNNIFDARNALQSSTGNTPAQIVPELRFNDFGGDVGGPVIKHKLFVFFGMEAKRLILPGDGTINLTVPTTAELMGNFADTGETLQAKGTVPDSCVGTYAGSTFMPSATGTGNAINPTCITGAGAATAKVYSMLETPGATPLSASSFANTPTTNNATFTPSTPQNWEEDVVRADYHPTQNHSMYFRSIHDHLLLVDPFGIFGPSHGSALPTSPSLRNRPGYDFQLADVWTASSHLVNEAKLTVAWNKQRIPVTGDLWQEATYGFTNTGTGANYIEPFGNVGPYPTGIPTLNVNGGTCAKNNCPAEVYGPYNYLLAPTVDISPTDNVTYSWRNHTFRFGALYARNRKDQNSRQESPEGNVTYSSASPNTTGDQFADALLGNYNSYTQLSGDPVGHYRFNDYGVYAADSWKVTHRLSLDLGLRWDYTVPTYAQANNLAFFDPSAYVQGLVTVPNNSSNVPASVGGAANLDCPGPPNSVAAAGPCVTGGYVTDGVLRTGAVPTDQLMRVTNGLSPFVTSVGVSGDRGFFNPEGLFGPRVGIAWSPFGDKTVIRAGWGVFYDKPEGNLVFGNTGVVPFVQSVTYTAGNLGALPASGATPTIGNTTGINPNLRVARDQQYSLSIQRELPDGIFFQVAYVGDHGWHELREPDINVPTFAAAATALAANAYGSTFINSIRPYPGFTDPQVYQSDGISNYNALQISATKTKGDSSFQLAYTWSKTLSTGTGLGDNLYPECAFTCTTPSGATESWIKYWYGPTTLDIPQVFVASYTLNEPFLKNLHGVEGGFLSHWVLSGVTRLQSGQALTVTGSGGIGAVNPATSAVVLLSGGTTFTNRANIVSGQALVDSVAQGGQSFGSGTCATGKICYVNAAAFGATYTSSGSVTGGTVPTTGTGNAPLGDIFGPGYYGWDLSLRKNFPIRESMNVTFQWDAFNAFNRVNYSNPSTTITGSTFGQITGANPPRQMQFGLKFNF
jgi:hypothetical protein